jgi:RES domain-containing protein
MVGRSEVGGITTEWVFRHCAEDHRNLRETSEHNRNHPGRYHVKGEFGAIYVACEEATALRELDHRAEKAGVPRAALLPRLMLTLHLRVQSLLDLTDDETRTQWGTTLEEITRSNDYTRCHEIARLARQAGYEAIRFPAFGGGGENYAVFYDRLRPGSELVVQHERSIDQP